LRLGPFTGREATRCSNTLRFCMRHLSATLKMRSCFRRISSYSCSMAVQTPAMPIRLALLDHYEDQYRSSACADSPSSTSTRRSTNNALDALGASTTVPRGTDEFSCVRFLTCDSRSAIFAFKSTIWDRKPTMAGGILTPKGNA